MFPWEDRDAPAPTVVEEEVQELFVSNFRLAYVWAKKEMSKPSSITAMASLSPVNPWLLNQGKSNFAVISATLPIAALPRQVTNGVMGGSRKRARPAIS